MSSDHSRQAAASPPALSLIPLTSSLLAKLQADLEHELVKLGVDIGAHRDLVGALIAQTAAMPCPPPQPTHWGGYMALDPFRMLVGFCAFKGAPTGAGAVEIAYMTVPDREGRGIATAMAAALVDLARADPSVGSVLAHTLPVVNASGRILTKLEFVRLGTVTDPEDGQVWRWELPIRR